MAARKAEGRDGARAVAADFLVRIQRAWGESPFYQSQLKGPAPDRLCYQIDDPYTADRAEAEQIMIGRFSHGADNLDCHGDPSAAFTNLDRSSGLYRYLHSFSWLRALSSLSDDGGRLRVSADEVAQSMTARWLADNERWSPETWDVALTAERLVMLCAHQGPVLKGTDVLWRSRLLASMARQTRHLMQSAHKARGNYERLHGAAALTLVGLCLPGCEPGVERGLELLRRELRLQLRPDGGHISRNPSRQLAILIRLKNICDALRARGMDEPVFLRHMMGRIRANAALFRLGDGGLAIFNGSHEDDGRALAYALHGVDDDPDDQVLARYSGYKRIDADRSVLIADIGPVQANLNTAGNAPPGRSSRSGRMPGNGARLSRRDAGRPLVQWQSGGSFNFAVGRARLIVNCGTGAHISGDWTQALRQAGAHSALSSEPAGLLGRWLDASDVTHKRGADRDGHLLEIERRIPAIGARHTRRLFLTPDGADLRGEDRLENFPAEILQASRLRFHLHPSVRASLSRDRRSVILALSNGEGWRFKTNYRLISLEKSIYCGHGALPVPCQQIVLSGPADIADATGLEAAFEHDMVLKWSFRRLSPS